MTVTIKVAALAKLAVYRQSEIEVGAEREDSLSVSIKAIAGYTTD